MRHLSVECRCEAWFLDFKRQVQGKWKGKGKGIGKSFLCPKCGIYLLNAALKRDLSISEGKYKGKMQMQRQMHRKMVFTKAKCRFEAWMQRQMHRKMVFYALNAAFISWMPLWSVICRFRFQKGKCKENGFYAKAKCRFEIFRKGKCMQRNAWFLCPKCGIYLLNAALKRDFRIDFRKCKRGIYQCRFEGKMQIQRQRQRQMHRKMRHFYALNANTKRHLSLECRFEAWFVDFRMQIQRQNANAKANA